MLIDLTFDERVMICECIRFREICALRTIGSRDSLPDEMLLELKVFLSCAPNLIDRLLADPEFENGGD